MKRFLMSIAIVLIISLSVLGTYTVLTYGTPSNYRTTKDNPHFIKSIEGYLKGYTHFNPTGLDRYNAAGSGRLNLQHLRDLLAKWNHKVIIIKGRKETFLYYKDQEIRKYCLKQKKSDKSIKKIRERDYISHLHCLAERWIDDVPNDLSLQDLRSEVQILDEMGVPLISPLTEGWLDNWEFVDDLIALFKSVPKDTLIYVHCGHGQGRTTTLLTLLDIFHSARDVSLHDIMARQYLLGGEDLQDVEIWAGGTWTSSDLKARQKLVTAFYQYMSAKDGYETHISWKDWLARSKAGVKPL